MPVPGTSENTSGGAGSPRAGLAYRDDWGRTVTLLTRSWTPAGGIVDHEGGGRTPPKDGGKRLAGPLDADLVPVRAEGRPVSGVQPQRAGDRGTEELVGMLVDAASADHCERRGPGGQQDDRLLEQGHAARSANFA